jgi:hypothetical protein
LYGIAFDGAPRLDLLPYSALAKTALSPDEIRAWVRCCITLNERSHLLEPMVIRTEHSVHLFEFAALKQAWRESFRFINPMSRQPVTAEQLLRLEPHDTAAAGAVKGP